MTIKAATQRFLDWTILLVWFVAGCVIFLFTANLQDLVLGLALMVLLALGPIAVCFIALRNRKRAAKIFLIEGVLAAGLLLFLDALDFGNNDHPLRSVLYTFAFTVIFFGVPAIYWLITSRQQWPPYLQHSISRWTKFALAASGFLVLMTASALMGIYQVLYYGDCSPRLFTSPISPNHSVYTAKIIYVHHPSGVVHYAGIVADFPWAVARTEHKYWGLSGWNQTFTILPYRNSRVGEEYLIAGHIRPSLIGYLVNLVDTIVQEPRQ